MTYLQPGRALLSLVVMLVGLCASGQELTADSDGGHVWLLTQSEERVESEPVLEVHHNAQGLRGPDAERPMGPRFKQIEPILGVPMPRGIAAGDGRLIVVLNTRDVLTLRPVWSELTRDWLYVPGTLPALPSDCGLRSLAVNQSGVWALVRVESPTLLAQLDRSGVSARVEDGPDAILNEALGLPRAMELRRSEPEQEQGGEATDEGGLETPADAEVDEEPQTEEAETSDQTGPEAQAAEDAAAEAQAQPPFVPVYRLIRADRARWVSVGLPADFGQPREAELVARAGDGRPTILARYATSTGTPIRVMRWSAPEPPPATAESDDTETNDAPASGGEANGADALAAAASPEDRGWGERTYHVPGLRNWSAVSVDGQVVVGVERMRSDRQLDVDLYVLRGRRALEISRLALPTDGMAQWALLSLDGRAGVLSVPGPRMTPYEDGTPSPPSMAGLRTATLDGFSEPLVIPIMPYEPTPMEANIDWLIQIIAYLAALLLMMMFWRRAPGDGQLRLPERVVLASIDKRLISGLIDLTPGLILAGAIYGVSWLEILMLWPGSPTDKTLAAMRPGLLVIGVTVVHTTLFELVTARSIGKWLTGLYVSDFRGKPAPPGASTVRAVIRLLDMVALLLLIIPLISPAKQRLGDILARTIVVTRLPDPEEQERKRKERERQLREQEDEY